MDKSIIIIGAGIAGLAAGCYGQMNGYRTQIFELHDKPGGLCTSWKRKGYTFDGCIHWLVGSGARQWFHRIWQELGAAQGRQIDRPRRVHARRRGKNGKTLIVYTNADRLERHLKDLAPADAKLIGEFCSAIRTLSRMDPPLDGEAAGPVRQAPGWVEHAACAWALAQISQDVGARLCRSDSAIRSCARHFLRLSLACPIFRCWGL